MSRKAITKIMAAMIATVMMTSFAACGGGDPSVDTAVSETAETIGVEQDSSQTGEGEDVLASNTTQDKTDPSVQGLVETKDEDNLPEGLIDDSGSSTSQQTTSREVTIENLAEYAGTYVASNGDSFVIPEEPAEWDAVDYVKLDSVPGWSGSEGFYDTFVATNLSMDGDKIMIEVTSQYTVGTGLLVIEKNGKAELTYVDFSSYETVGEDYQNSSFMKQ